ncbi:50S ribosomal protein L16 [Candidatus Woesearchaeota archaeon]|nr:50S ribosomal protein L16 [Candidatus Woesearchaeota archaeon]
MAGIRKFSCYRKVKRAYTRKSRYKVKGYVKATPVCKMQKFNFGDNKRTFPHKVFLVSKEKIQVRHNALESARTSVVRRLTNTLGKDYHFQIRAYPHHVLRENKMITGAGADRMQTGMQRSFGKAMSLAAQLKEGTPIFCVYVEKTGIPNARIALKSASPKLPGKCAIEVQ